MADSALAVAGLKITFKVVSLFRHATEIGGAGLKVKSLAFAPDGVMAEIVSVALPVLLIVTCLAALAMLTV